MAPANSFMILPIELRVQVYNYLFTFPDPIHPYHLHFEEYEWIWGALRVNQELRTEGSKVLFSNNVFDLGPFDSSHFIWETPKFKRADILTAPLPTRWPDDGETGRYIALPLPREGTIVNLQSVQVPRRLFQRDYDGENCVVLEAGIAFHLADIEIQPQSWDARSLVKHIQFTVPIIDHAQADVWASIEVTCKIVELVTTQYLTNLTSVQLDLSNFLYEFARLDYPPGPVPSFDPFVVNAEQLTVAWDKSSREMDSIIGKHIQAAARNSRGDRSYETITSDIDEASASDTNEMSVPLHRGDLMD